MGRVWLQVPMLYVVAFVITFVIGGLSGVMIAAVPLDLQLHDTYFIVAHFHYVLIGGGVFPLLGAITYWFPKFTGRMMSDGAGKVVLLDGLPRLPARLLPDAHFRAAGHAAAGYTYPAGMGLEIPNLLSSIGGVVVALGGAAVRYQHDRLAARGGRRRPNPWGAATLEWATTSPPPRYNFAHIPAVERRTPCGICREQLASRTGSGRRARTAADQRHRCHSRRSRAERRAERMAVHRRRGDTVTFICSIFSPWAWLFGTCLPPLR